MVTFITSSIIVSLKLALGTLSCGDCWDAEILTTSGWVECVGHADRACFDLTQHQDKTGTRLEAQVTYDEPVCSSLTNASWTRHDEASKATVCFCSGK